MITNLTNLFSIFLFFVTFSSFGQSLNNKPVSNLIKSENVSTPQDVFDKTPRQTVNEKFEPNIIEIVKIISEQKKNTKIELTAPDHDEQRKLIGRIMWYANLQDVEDELLIELLNSCKNYPKLNEVIAGLVYESTPLEKFFSKSASELEFFYQNLVS